MKYFKKLKPQQWQVYAFDADGSQDDFIQERMVPITKDEAEIIANTEPKDELVLDILRASSTQRNWSFPPSKYQEAIGQVVVSASNVEVLIRTVIWHIANIDSDIGRAFTGGARINDLVDTLKALIECRAPHLTDDATNIGSSIKIAFTERAKYVHQVWTVADGKPAIGKLFIDRYARKEKVTPVSLSEMYELSDKMLEIQSQLMSKILEPLLNPSS